jgi:histidyl-tRNA synthetase
VAFPQIAAWLGDDAEGQALLKEWEQTINLLGDYGIHEDQIIIQADLTKNWEYYTGLVFGVEAGDDNYIVGGGRYDELTRVLGSDNNVPAIGFAYYVDAMLPLIASHDEQRIRVILKGDANMADLIGWATFLRNNEIAVVINSGENGTLITVENSRACLNEKSYLFSEKDNLLKNLKASIL